MAGYKSRRKAEKYRLTQSDPISIIVPFLSIGKIKSITTMPVDIFSPTLLALCQIAKCEGQECKVFDFAETVSP